jgi:hypothetical protein
MGVMRCNRGNCERILCDLYSRAYGYICAGCFEELVASRTMDIAAFMDSDPPFGVPGPTREYYEKIFVEGG